MLRRNLVIVCVLSACLAGMAIMKLAGVKADYNGKGQGLIILAMLALFAMLAEKMHRKGFLVLEK